MAILPTDWRSDPVAAGILLASTTAALESRETTSREPGTAQQKLYYSDPGPATFAAQLMASGILIHGATATAIMSQAGGSFASVNSAVFACLAVIAKAFQEAPLRVFRKTKDGKEEWDDAHPFQELVNNPHPALTPVEISSWLQFAKHIAGNAYLRKVRAGAGNVVELWPLSPATMAAMTSREERMRGVFIGHYRWEYESGKYEDIPTEDVVHFRMGVDDRDHRYGCSPLQRLLREVATDDAATLFTDQLLRNFGIPGLTVELPENVSMTKEQAEELRDRIQAAYGGESKGRVGVLTGGAKMAQFGFNPQQLDLKGIHRLPEERIAAVLGVHPMVAGLGAGLDRSTFSNFEEAREALFEQTVIPLYTADAATWQKQVLRPDFDTSTDVLLRYDLTDVRALQPDMNEIYTRLSVAVEKGWVKRNEARSEVGLPPVDGWDEEDEAPAPEPPSMLPGANDPNALTGGPDGAQDGPQRALPPPKKALTAEQKMRAFGAIPGLLDVVHDLAAPALERDLSTYLEGQRRRVAGRLKRGA